jgi:hypothetical protein
MEGLAVSIQSRELRFPKGQISYELELFEYEVKPSGIRYSAPAGHNDDCVAALALARQMWTETAPGANIMKFYADTSARLRDKEAKTSALDNRPWEGKSSPLLVEVGDLGGNELEDLYNETAAQTMPENKKVCVVCSERVLGAERVTDGELYWHVGCAGTMFRKSLEAYA